MNDARMSLRSFTKDKDLVTRSIAGETLIVPVRSGVCDLEHIYVLNEVGSRIWELVDDRIPVSQIANAICSEYEVPLEQAACDIDELLRSLETAALIHATGEGGG